MEKATSVQTRKSLEAANVFIKNGLRFIPIPVIDDEDQDKLLALVAGQLDKIEELVD